MKNLLKISLLFTFSLLIIYACTKEEAETPEFIDRVIENRDANVWICHKPDGPNPTAIWVNENSVNAHLAHGDVLLDADGDGYTSINACGEGSMDDCDDNDPGVYPGAEEICDDGIDNNCDGQVDEDCGAFSLICELWNNADYNTVNPADGSYHSCLIYEQDCGNYNYSSLIYLAYNSDNEEVFFVIRAFDMTNNNCEEWINEDYHIYAFTFDYTTRERCIELYGFYDHEDEDYMGDATIDDYNAVLALQQSLASQFYIPDQCSEGATNGGISATALQHIPDHLKKLMEEAGGLLPRQE
jgi:hypothetical protein